MLRVKVVAAPEVCHEPDELGTVNTIVEAVELVQQYLSEKARVNISLQPQKDYTIQFINYHLRICTDWFEGMSFELINTDEDENELFKVEPEPEKFEPKWQHYEQVLKALVKNREFLIELIRMKLGEPSHHDPLFEEIRQSNLIRFPMEVRLIQEMIDYTCSLCGEAAEAFQECQDRGDPGLKMSTDDRVFLDLMNERKVL